MPRLRGFRALALLPFACSGALAGCAAESGSGSGSVAPSIVALSTYEASLGTVIEAYGSGFPLDESADAELVFEGEFVSDNDPQARRVSFTSPAKIIDGSTVRWTTFGPFNDPFGGGTGEFRGTITPRLVRREDRSVVESTQSSRFALRVKPSLLIREFQPTTASCAQTAKRALGDVPYRIAVEALDFDPISFTYTLTAPGVLEQGLEFKHLVSGHTDSLGTREDFIFPAVPEGKNSYLARINVLGESASGERFLTGFTIQVRRPLEVFYNGNVEIAEALAPVPVSACTPGGPNGRSWTYEEATHEMRTRNYQVHWDQHWVDTHFVSSETMGTIGWMEQNGVGFSTTDTDTWHWSVGGSVSASLDVGGMVGAGVSTNYSMGGDRSRSQQANVNRTEGVNTSDATTEGVSEASSVGGGSGGVDSWSVSSATSISQSFGGTVIANHYGVFYRQTLRLLRRAAIVAYNQCGDATVVADVDFEDWTWAPDLAIGPNCIPLPESNLPQAACFVEPCTGE